MLRDLAHAPVTREVRWKRAWLKRKKRAVSARHRSDMRPRDETCLTLRGATPSRLTWVARVGRVRQPDARWNFFTHLRGGTPLTIRRSGVCTPCRSGLLNAADQPRFIVRCRHLQMTRMMSRLIVWFAGYFVAGIRASTPPNDRTTVRDTAPATPRLRRPRPCLQFCPCRAS